MFFKVFFGLLLLAISFNQSMAQTMPTIDAGVSRELARWRADNYSDVRYKLNLTLEKMSPVLKGTIEISVNNNADLFILDWRKIRGKEDSSKISNLSVNGKNADFEEINEHLVLRDGIVKNAINVIKLDFTSPIATNGAAITRYVDKEDGAEYIYSLFVPSDASIAFPCFDQPDLKAKFSLIVNAPSNWKVISNEPFYFLNSNYDHLPESVEEARRINKKRHEESGARGEYIFSEEIFELSQKIPPAGRRLYYFYETKPISTYVFSFAAGEFVSFSEQIRDFDDDFIPLGFIKNSSDIEYGYDRKLVRNHSLIYVRKSQTEKFEQHAAEIFRLNLEAVKYLESYFDYKFPFPKYDLVLIPEFSFGGMEHAGATFLREDRVIFPSEPTANDYITRGNLIFHEAAHQWFGDLVTMRWFDDLWLKEGFAEFMAYKTMEKVLPQYNAWKAFYERNKPLAYQTDSTRGTTPIYQEIPNLSAAKSAYGNIVYRKAPSFLRQAEFYLGTDNFQIAVRQFLKKYEFSNATWQNLVNEFEIASKNDEQKGLWSNQDLEEWADFWVKQRGLFKIRIVRDKVNVETPKYYSFKIESEHNLDISVKPRMKFFMFIKEYYRDSKTTLGWELPSKIPEGFKFPLFDSEPYLIFPNYQDYGYGIFLLDEKSRDYILANIQNEKDDFLRAMMWGALWDSVREAELNSKDYVELAIKNIGTETDELTIQTILGRVSTAMNYYLSDNERTTFSPQLENLLIDKMQNAPTLGQRITFYRAFLNVASGEKARIALKDILTGKFQITGFKLKTKDKFDIATALAVLGDADAPRIIQKLIKTETSDEAKRYAYAAQAGFPKQRVKEKYFGDFLNNKEISESYLESALAPFNSPKNAIFTLPFLEKALAELPNFKRNRKIFFVNGWLAAFINGQRGAGALEIVNKFLKDNPNLDKDLGLKILESSDGLERAIKIRKQFADQSK